MQDNLARALDELVTLSHEHPPADGTIAALAATIVAAGGALPYPGTVAEAAATSTDTVPNPQPQDRDLILGILQDLDRRVLQALADNYPQGRKMEAEQSAALRRLLERAEVSNPQPDDRDLILEVIHDLDRRVLQARADDDPQGCALEAEQSAALRRLLERADDYLGWQARDAQVERPA